MTRKDWVRLVLATLLAPLIAGAIACAIIASLSLPDMIFEVSLPVEGTESVYETRPATALEITRNLAGMGLFGALISAMVGIPGMLLLGLPAHSALVKRRRTGLIIYALCGLVAGTLTMLVYFGATSGGQIFAQPDWLFLSGPLAGTLGAGLFWLIRRPDRIGA